MKIVAFLAMCSALTGFLSAYYWVRSALAEQPAPPNTSGVGALYGGYLISINKKGERIDLHETLKLQTNWNAKAAISAAASAGLASLAAGAQLFSTIS